MSSFLTFVWWSYNMSLFRLSRLFPTPFSSLARNPHITFPQVTQEMIYELDHFLPLYFTTRFLI